MTKPWKIIDTFAEIINTDTTGPFASTQGAAINIVSCPTMDGIRQALRFWLPRWCDENGREADARFVLERWGLDEAAIDWVLS